MPKWTPKPAEAEASAQTEESQAAPEKPTTEEKTPLERFTADIIKMVDEKIDNAKKWVRENFAPKKAVSDLKESLNDHQKEIIDLKKLVTSQQKSIDELAKRVGELEDAVAEVPHLITNRVATIVAPASVDKANVGEEVRRNMKLSDFSAERRPQVENILDQMIILENSLRQLAKEQIEEDAAKSETQKRSEAMLQRLFGE